MRSNFATERVVRVETETVGPALVLRLGGHIDDLGADVVSDKLDQVLGAGHCRILFDLGDVMFMGSSGLGQIMRTYQAVKKRNGYVRIVNPQPLIADVFKLTKLDRLLRIYPSVSEALADVQ